MSSNLGKAPLKHFLVGHAIQALLGGYLMFVDRYEYFYIIKKIYSIILNNLMHVLLQIH